MIEINWTRGGMFVGADAQVKAFESSPLQRLGVEWDGTTKTLRVTVDGKDVPMVECSDGVWRERVED